MYLSHFALTQFPFEACLHHDQLFGVTYSSVDSIVCGR